MKGAAVPSDPMLYREIGPSHPTTLAFHSIWPPTPDTPVRPQTRPNRSLHSLTQPHTDLCKQCCCHEHDPARPTALSRWIGRIGERDWRRGEGYRPRRLNTRVGWAGEEKDLRTVERGCLWRLVMRSGKEQSVARTLSLFDTVKSSHHKP